MKSNILALVVLGMSLNAQAGTLVCDYTATAFPIQSKKTDLNIKGSISLDLDTSQAVYVSYAGAGTKRKYTVIGQAWKMVDGIQIQFGLFTGVKMEEGGRGYTGTPLVSSITTFGYEQKEIRHNAQGSFSIISINCKP